ncbi:MAG TPA: AsnC family protein [Actinophytocola sp.]|uniref:AsnC family protein n=1 Tax=Actinophytocola sp. TaxID=1872138 RepID=UPI002DBC7CF3|nr:AsnC family protein [Actinophytocola sp.]HEU5474500.1 AsnC family protein [Actinophytocola sp.]
MVATDPVDVRLLSLVAEMGRAAVHDIAARLGMDPREVASRLVALSASGLPLLVGVECDPNRLRAALAARPQPGAYAPPAGYPQPYPTPAPGGFAPGVPSGAYSVPSGPYPPPPPSNPVPAQTGPPSNPFPQPMSTWGPPQTASWARGDQPPQDLTVPTARSGPANGARTGTVGATLLTEGLEGERLAIQLVEVVDPADYLFTAAGYRLQDGERSVVVHTELTNRGGVPFQSLPDLYLVLVTPDGRTIAKAPVSLSSRPPHRIGVAPGETAGGHTVYVVPESTVISSVRWSPRPDDQSRTLNWTIES